MFIGPKRSLPFSCCSDKLVYPRSKKIHECSCTENLLFLNLKWYPTSMSTGILRHASIMILIRPAPNKMASSGLLEGGRRELRTYRSSRTETTRGSYPPPCYLPFHWTWSGAEVALHQSKCIWFFYGLRDVKAVASSIGLKKEASTIKIHPPTRIPRWRASDRTTRGGISRPCAPLKAAVPDVTDVR